MKKICPHCSSKNTKKNGHTHYGKQNNQCNDCGRQFVEGGQEWFISEVTKELIDSSGLTAYIERFNGTLRQRASRLVRKALSFSKSLDNHIGAIKYFLCHYNLTVKALRI